MKKIAIYGGSFDPPHKGHKLLAENLASVCGAEKVIIIPTALSPFKNSSSATAEDRLNMCKLFFKEDLFSISDIEIKRGGKSYTVDTVSELKKLYPEDDRHRSNLRQYAGSLRTNILHWIENNTSVI